MSHYYRSLLYHTRYLNVATITETDNTLEPHCSIVFFHATDKAIYWTSRRTAQHSKNIERDPRVFITLFEENLKEGTGVGKGLYLRGTVRMLTDVNEIKQAKEESIEKANRDREPWTELDVPAYTDFVNNSTRAVYCFTPEVAWSNTWHRSVGDERVWLELKNFFPAL